MRGGNGILNIGSHPTYNIITCIQEYLKPKLLKPEAGSENTALWCQEFEASGGKLKDLYFHQDLPYLLFFSFYFLLSSLTYWSLFIQG